MNPSVFGGWYRAIGAMMTVVKEKSDDNHTKELILDDVIQKNLQRDV